MKENQKRYWKGLEQFKNDPEFVKNNEKEFPDYLPINSNSGEGGPSRRDFLKMMGFGFAAATLAACEAPVMKAIPYLNKPVEIDPTIPNYYASTYAKEGDFCSLVVKTREGRPIKIEGNRFSTITEGGTSPQVQASILSLYDITRLKEPYNKGQESDWINVDKAIISGLQNARNLRVVSNTIMSPSTQSVINDFTSRFGGEHVMYESYSSYALIEAHNENFGQRAVPSYDFSKANVIVSFGADFLGTWLSVVEFNTQYSKTRKVGPEKKTMSRHYQFESILTLTGSNADYRTAIKPSQEGVAVAALYQLITGGDGGAIAQEFPHLRRAAKDLLDNQGKSLVVSSSNDIAVQRLVNAINIRLNNYGKTIDISRPAFHHQGNDVQMTRFIRQAQAGEIDAVIFFDCNPVYDFAVGSALGEALKGNKIKLSVSTSSFMDETAALCGYVAPDHHYLESWNDYQPKVNHFSMAQPTIRPIFNTRQAQESLLTWMGAPDASFYSYMQNQWREKRFAEQQQFNDFQTFWDSVLYVGVYVPGRELNLEPNIDELYETADTVEDEVGELPVFSGDVNRDVREINAAYKPNQQGLELVLYQKVGIGSGRQANNPWLQELPDPVTKATWDNYLTIPITMAEELGVEMQEQVTGVVNLVVDGKAMEVPVLIQPGQANGTVGLALGFGRTEVGNAGKNIGVNAYPLIRLVDGVAHYYRTGVQVEKTDKKYRIARTQTQGTYMGRETIIQESTLDEYQKDPEAGRFKPMIATANGPLDPDKISLWDGHLYPNHHWGMAIDLNSCTGCSACVVACHVENNVPVVGKDEVLNRRDMFWLRIDRYYSSEAEDGDYIGMEKASENPQVIFQPMLCQQCNNAPCETVCPVTATSHNSEGLSQMTYNRCIGTRYCANNCPYKVRRFNWFKYHDNKAFYDVNPMMNTDLGKMVLNPDVTVRARGVMEKCSFCVQRIQAGKLKAKSENRRLIDGEVITACASACPTDAIIFGDMNNNDSRIVKLLKSEEKGRAYNVLKEIGTRPNIFYLTKIRNIESDSEEVNA